MKRTSLLGLVSLLASVLAGCPIYSGNGSQGSGTNGCLTSASCNPNETCGQDGQCHPGDCTLWGCNSGTCVVDPSTETASCNGAGGNGGNGGSGGTGGTGGTGGIGGTGGTGGGVGKVVYCGHPADCAAGETCAVNGTCKAGDCTVNQCIFGYSCGANNTCVSKTPNACDNDTECTQGSGDLCIAGPKGGGVCTKPSDQCFDQSQCDSGDKCVAGKCIPACTTNADCRDGYACNTGLGVCNTPIQTCTITNDCGGVPSKVCVAGVCVPRSNNGMCSAGDVWAENGCIPNQAPTFTCVTDGQQDACAINSICLHHSCWISCDAPNQTVCNNQPSLNSCKLVVSTSGMHNVCGTAQNLGGECDPTDPTKACTGGGQLCIDGFCK